MWLEADCLKTKGLQQVDFVVARLKAEGLYNIPQGAISQPEPSMCVALPPPKMHRWVPTATVLHLTAQEAKASALGALEQAGPPLPVPQPQGPIFPPR